MEILSSENIKFDVIEKRNITNKREDKDGIITYYYKKVRTRFGKFLRFVKYARFVKHILETKQYDCIVLFGALNSAFCYHWMPKVNKQKYIVDIRDYDLSSEIPIVKTWLKHAVEDAGMVVISSAKFKKWLPTNTNFHVMHNLPDIRFIIEHTKVFSRREINIGYLGGIGYYEQNVSLVNAFHESSNIILSYYGRYPSTTNIRDYCNRGNYSNVKFFEEYNNEEKIKLYDNVDLINAIYGDDTLVVTTALPNKLYDCICYKIPIIVSKYTYLSEIVDAYQIGFSVDTKVDNLSHLLKEYVQNFNASEFEAACSRLLNKVQLEQKITDNHLLKYLEDEG